MTGFLKIAFRSLTAFLTQNYADSKWSWMGGSTYRLHRFRAAAAAIKGLTADVLVRIFFQVNTIVTHRFDPARS